MYYLCILMIRMTGMVTVGFTFVFLCHLIFFYLHYENINNKKAVIIVIVLSMYLYYYYM